MFHRFTEKAIKVIMLAQEESRRTGHKFVGTEQILLGLIGEGSGVAAQALKSLNVSLKDARIEVEKIIGREGGHIPVELPFTPRAKRALEFSWDEARLLSHKYVGTEHLLLGLLREHEGVAVRVLENMNVDLSRIQENVLEILENVGALSSLSSPDLVADPLMPEGVSAKTQSEEIETILARFADDAKACVFLAQEEARRLRFGSVGSEETLIGLIMHESSVASQALRSMHVSLDAARLECKKFSRTTGLPVTDKIPFTPRMKRIIRLSADIADKLKCPKIAAEHVLLAMLEEPVGVAVRVLELLKVDPNALRKEVLELIEQNG